MKSNVTYLVKKAVLARHQAKTNDRNHFEVYQGDTYSRLFRKGKLNISRGHLQYKIYLLTPAGGLI
jgi:hypothetical protein